MPTGPLDGLAEAIAAATVWCPCYGTSQPVGPWVAPDDQHADTHVLDWLQTRTGSLPSTTPEDPQ